MDIRLYMCLKNKAALHAKAPPPRPQARNQSRTHHSLTLQFLYVFTRTDSVKFSFIPVTGRDRIHPFHLLKFLRSAYPKLLSEVITLFERSRNCCRQE